MKPICVPCQRFFRCKKNDFPFIEAMPTDAGGNGFAGAAYPDHWEAYKLWFGDRWECEGCGASIIVGVARQPLAIHHQPDFDKYLTIYKPELQVNDC